MIEQFSTLHIFAYICTHYYIPITDTQLSTYRAANATATATPPIAHCALPVIRGIPPPMLTAEVFADAELAKVDKAEATEPVEAAVVAPFVVTEAVDAVANAAVVAGAPNPPVAVTEPAVIVTAINADL